MRDFERACVTLPPAQQRALVMVGANGLSYEEAAKLTGCMVGTMKSRVSRARGQLMHLMGRDQPRSPGKAMMA
jgi:DNA-directed RNA polymerase specialized sigma24 family protein